MHYFQRPRVTQAGTPTQNRLSNFFFRMLGFRKQPEPIGEPLNISCFELSGCRCLAIELRDRHDDSAYSEKWKNLVAKVVMHVKASLKSSGKEREKEFIEGVMQAMEKLRIRSGDVDCGFLHIALNRMRFNCVHSTLLAYDVAQILGIPVQLVEAPGHLMLKTENFYFETRLREYGPIAELADIRPGYRISTCSIVESAAHNSLGRYYFDNGYYSRALAEFKRALEINPNDPCASENLSKAEQNLDREAKTTSEDWHNEPLEIYM